VSCEWTTREIGSAVSPLDFIAAEGTLTFADGVASKQIDVTVVDDARYEKDERFQIVLSQPTGTSFTPSSDGYPDQAIATVTIISDDDRRTAADRLTMLLDLNVDSMMLGAGSWAEQFSTIGTLPERGEQGRCSFAYLISLAMYALSVPWMFIVACVPPTRFWGGWLCFFCCLCLIGIITAIIGDLANHVGCCLHMPASVTAITFVALGTSLPDTFASMQAARSELYADNAIGNITGSNAVNVFLGLGLPWAIASIFWANASEASEASWRLRYANEPWYSPSMKVGFAVPSGDLGFSVMVFSGCAVVCLALLSLRRATLGFELGGPFVAKVWSVFVLVSLWGLYLVLSIAAENGLLPPAVTSFPF